MSVLLQLLVATAVIAALISLRMYSNRQVAPHRGSCDGSGRQKDCAGGCSGLKAAVERGAGPADPI